MHDRTNKYDYPKPLLAERNPLRASHRRFYMFMFGPKSTGPKSMHPKSLHILYEFFGRGETAVINTYLV